MPAMDRSSIARRAFQNDFDRALSARFAPKHKQHGLHLLVVFDHELARVRHQTSEPLLRRIRYQFWRDALLTKGEGGLELANHLIRCFASDPLPAGDLVKLIDVHEGFAEVENTDANYRNEFIERQIVLFELGSHYLCSKVPPALDHLFARCGLTYGEVMTICSGVAKEPVNSEKIRQISSQTEKEYRALSLDISALSPQVRPALLPLALVPPYLHLFQSSDRIAINSVDLHPVKKAWMLWRTMRNGF